MKIKDGLPAITVTKKLDKTKSANHKTNAK